jgi:hypothetical protein
VHPLRTSVLIEQRIEFYRRHAPEFIVAQPEKFAAESPITQPVGFTEDPLATIGFSDADRA